MGDRAQVAIKDSSGKVYLYGHWIGADIYKAAAHAIKKYPGRSSDSEYFARIVFDEMKGDNIGETGFGIGLSAHGDVEHMIPVMDCERGVVSWEMPEWKHNKKPAPPEMDFAQFANLALTGHFDSL